MGRVGGFVAVVILLLGVAATAEAVPNGMRYCSGPGAAGNYVAATPNVSCRTARHVADAMFSNRCINRVKCRSHGFLCRSRYPGARHKPFSYTHHGRCRK